MGSALFLLAASADARTWRITPDGSGDAPHLNAAMDSATAGDTVLVAPGEYEIGPILVTDGIVFNSEEGPIRTKLTQYPGTKGGLGCTALSIPTVISGFWFDSFVGGGNEGLGAISILDCLRITIRNCVFSNNNFAGIAIDTQWRVVIENCTFADNVYALNIVSGSGLLAHNILWNPVDGLELSFVTFCNDLLNLQDVPATYQSSNFSVDPQFCATGDCRIATSSPCAPGNSPLGGSCMLVGALPPDCTTSPVEGRSWGAIKALYRTRR